MYIDLADPLPKSYATKKGEEMNRSTYGTMRYNDNVFMPSLNKKEISLFQVIINVKTIMALVDPGTSVNILSKQAHEGVQIKAQLKYCSSKIHVLYSTSLQASNCL